MRNAAITNMPHPPRLVVGGDFEGGLTSVVAMTFGRGICLIGRILILTAHVHICISLI